MGFKVSGAPSIREIHKEQAEGMITYCRGKKDKVLH